MGKTLDAQMTDHAKPESPFRTGADRYIHLLVPVSVVLMAALLNWITMQHMGEANRIQEASITRASSQLMSTISRLPNENTAQEIARLGLLDSITTRAEVVCARLRFPNGALFESAQATGSCAGAPDNTTAITIQRDGLQLTALYTSSFVEKSYSNFLRLTLVALLCGLSIAIVFNSLSHSIFVKRELLMRCKAQRRAQQARMVAERAARKANDTSEIKSNFLAIMSHEIRTPLNGIVGMAGLLTDSLNDETKRGYAQIISTSGQALLRILNDTLDLSKIEAGKLTMLPETTDLKLAIMEAVTLFSARAVEKRIDLVYKLDEHLPEHVLVDPMRLRQLVTNLVSNAIKFTDTGGVAVRAQLQGAPSRPGHAKLLLQVTDTGIGIDAAALEQVFERFSQASQPAVKAAQGTGLGLAICHEITNLMGGTIKVESTQGEGTTFTISLELPIVDAPAPGSSHTSADTASTPANTPCSEKVLLVNNNSGVAQQQTLKLKSRGYKVRHVATFNQACSAVESGHCGAVVANLDQEMDMVTEVQKFLTIANTPERHVIGMSEQPSRIGYELTRLVDTLVVTPGTWDDLLRELAFASIIRNEAKQSAA
jgi:signal transduction histidine kinase